MLLRRALLAGFAATFLLAVHTTAGAESSPATNGCGTCHAYARDQFAPGHAFGADGCIVCHAGDATATDEVGGHRGLLAFPGELENADRACGSCHAERVRGVQNGLMHRGTGMVDVTRQIIDGPSQTARTNDLQSLGHTPADSMLRKLCAACHLGQTKTDHAHDVTHDRGGGCLACHINTYPDDAHPRLSRQVSDARCFGCHSRSGRISLSYAGLAEIDPEAAAARGNGPVLADGRTVTRMPADVHYAAGMACIDCHTAVGLMGGIEGASRQRDAVDIACTDCHFPARQTSPERPRAPIVTARSATPLNHVQRDADGASLRTRLTGRALHIPPLSANYHEDDRAHARLDCNACHSRWAPQCFGCHEAYDPDENQFDHVRREETAGRWAETRWDFRNVAPTLGVNSKGRIEPFVPGMIMTVSHPDWDRDRFVRRFAPLSPHTTGPSRDCASCHRSSLALGLGEGALVEEASGWRFVPRHVIREDGLPADAWTSLDGTAPAPLPNENWRPLTPAEIRRVLSAPLDDTAGGEKRSQ